MLLLNTVKLVLIALNIIPNRIRHKKIMFFIYMGTLVTHGKMIDSENFDESRVNWNEKNQ